MGARWWVVVVVVGSASFLSNFTYLFQETQVQTPALSTFIHQTVKKSCTGKLTLLSGSTWS